MIGEAVQEALPPDYAPDVSRTRCAPRSWRQGGEGGAMGHGLASRERDDR